MSYASFFADIQKGKHRCQTKQIKFEITTLESEYHLPLPDGQCYGNKSGIVHKHTFLSYTHNNSIIKKLICSIMMLHIPCKNEWTNLIGPIKKQFEIWKGERSSVQRFFRWI